MSFGLTKNPPITHSTLFLNYLRRKQIFVNPNNLPQCRPIENCHAIIKRAIFADGFEPETAQELMDRTIKILSQSQNLLRPVRVRKLLDKTRRLGLYACLLYTSPSPRD